ncbi:MAG: hypothetical protein IRZ09_01340 [Variibacter sp.]|nr:hypothetical protein [Variibacter sp.]
MRDRLKHGGRFCSCGSDRDSRIAKSASSLLAITVAALHAWARGPIAEAGIAAQQERQREQLERYFDRQIAEAEKLRSLAWKRDFSSLAAYQMSVAPWREKLREWLGGMAFQPAALAPKEMQLAETEGIKACSRIDRKAKMVGQRLRRSSSSRSNAFSTIFRADPTWTPPHRHLWGLMGRAHRSLRGGASLRARMSSTARRRSPSLNGK